MRELAQPGTVIRGECFISRGEVEEEVREAIRGGRRPSSISVYGQPRVGKTSLVLHVADEWRRDGPLDRSDDNGAERVFVFLDCGRYRSDGTGALVGPQIFQDLVEQLIDELRTRPGFEFGGDFRERLQRFEDALQGRSAAQVELHARRLIDEITGRGQRANLLLILDEGDELQGRFDSAIGGLPDWMSGRHGVPIPVVMISRRICSQIEDQGGDTAGSGWCRSFAQHVPVGMFSEASRRTMIEVALERIDGGESRRTTFGSRDDGRAAQLEGALDRSCGRHPYLVNHFLAAFVATNGGLEERVGSGLRRVRQEEQVLFDRLVRRFGDDELLPDLLATLFVPDVSIGPQQWNLISQYELARYDDGRSCRVAMSPDFGSYLRHMLRSELVAVSHSYDSFLVRLFALVRALAGDDLDALPQDLREAIHHEYQSEAERQQQLFKEDCDWCSVMLVTEAVAALRQLLEVREGLPSGLFHDRLLPALDEVTSDVLRAVRKVPLGAVLDRLARPGNDLDSVEDIRSQGARIDEESIDVAIALLDESLRSLDGPPQQ